MYISLPSISVVQVEGKESHVNDNTQSTYYAHSGIQKGGDVDRLQYDDCFIHRWAASCQTEQIITNICIYA